MCASPRSSRSSTTLSPPPGSTHCGSGLRRWAGPAAQIITIDTDQGHSGASAADREGFQHLTAEVGMGRAGIVLGLEVSRLARNNADWHRLLEICALSATLICDEDGLYDPAEFNDRLLLGLKGTMSEAELHFIRARLRGGQLSAARRGELRVGLPVGLVYDGAGHVVLDPDAGVQQAIRHLFAVFTRAGSARAVVAAFGDEKLLFPVRIGTGPRKGELAWMALTHWRVLRTLHNPRYAGAFAYGRRREAVAANGKKTFQALPRDQWTALFPGAHPGYITWEAYEANQKLLLGNAAARGTDRAAGPAREGTALVQGLAVCGRCGRRLTVRYHTRGGIEVPDYQCVREAIDNAGRRCQTIPGAPADAAIGQLLLATLTPLSLEVALTVQAEIEARAADADTMRRGHVERARHRADLARRRYLGAGWAGPGPGPGYGRDVRGELAGITAAGIAFTQRSRELAGQPGVPGGDADGGGQVGVLPGVQWAEPAGLGMPGLVGFAGRKEELPADQVPGLRRLQLAADHACPAGARRRDMRLSFRARCRAGGIRYPGG
jgi:DNA invertase Pin-like site-specific DNA recombinase